MRTMTAEQRQEAKTERWSRRQLAKDGFRLCKSRIRGWTNSDDQGGYMIVHTYTNVVEAGSRFDMSLDDVVTFCKDDAS